MIMKFSICEFFNNIFEFLNDAFKKLIYFLIDHFSGLLIFIIYLFGVKDSIHDFTNFPAFIVISLGFALCNLVIAEILDFFDILRRKFDDNKK